MDILDEKGNVIAIVDPSTGEIKEVDSSALQVIFNSWQKIDNELKRAVIVNDFLLEKLKAK